MLLCVLHVIRVFLITMILGRSPMSKASELLPSAPSISPTTLPGFSTHTSTSTNNTVLTAQPDCFNQLNPPFPALREIFIEDCFVVLFEILRFESATNPVLWDRQVSHFPIWNTHGTCAVGLYAKYSNSKDVFAAVAVAQRAARIMENCVKLRAQPSKLGGKTNIGTNGGFYVAIYGRGVIAGGGLGVPDVGMNKTAIA
ncbi:hypothetical protein N7G274_006699 [Stereocaulon virgatum]|uniref:Uncharacterized protein n=1 Tax=Stereocaulon virgatum TaxID=373712 RepID=A0ABR4A5K7_9LECA